MALIVILRQNQIEGAVIGAVKHRIGRNRTLYVNPLGLRDLDARRDLHIILAPEQAVLAAMGIDARNRDARVFNAHAPQMAMTNADRLGHPLGRGPADRILQRNMGRDMDDIQPLGRQQHP